MSYTKIEVVDENRKAVQPQPRKSNTLTRLGTFVIAGLLLAGAVSLAIRYAEGKTLAKETAQSSLRTVAVFTPQADASGDEIVLPSTLQAYVESPIYSRTNGYLRRWYKDIGSRVNKGDLLADIDTPEVDQELLQTRAAREQAVAKLGLAKASADRWQNLRQSDSVSQQEADERSSQFTQAQADVAAAEANVRRLQQLESFKHIYAPFSGILTRRNVDIGALVNAGNGGSNRELFVIAQTDPLRVYVNVPQTYAPLVKPGMQTKVTLSEYPNESFQGKVVRTADAIDPATRTLLTEIDLPNKAGRLFPGSYAQVHFGTTLSTHRLTVPINALLFRGSGPTAAVVGNEDKIRLAKISIGRDFGSSVEVLDGITPNDRIVLNPPDGIEDGEQVKVSIPTSKPAQGGR